MGRKLRGGAIVQIACITIISVPIIHEGKAEEGAGVTSVRSDRSLQVSNNFTRAAAHRRNRLGTLIQLLGGLLNRSRQLIEAVHSVLRPAVLSQLFGLRERHGIAGSAGPRGRSQRATAAMAEPVRPAAIFTRMLPKRGASTPAYMSHSARAPLTQPSSERSAANR